MTRDEPGREPTNTELLAAINALAAAQRQHGETLTTHSQAIAGVAQRLESLHTGVDEALDVVAQNIDVLGEKVDSGFLAANAGAELEESRHTEVTQALEALAELAHAQHAQLAGLREEVGGDVRAAEARIASRLDDLRRAVHALKTDFVRHANDPGAHHRHGNAA